MIVPGLGPLESAIMTAVWDAGQPLTVGAVCDRLNYRTGGGGDPAYTTVMTVMNILWRKGLLSRAKHAGGSDTRPWWYQARVTRESYLAAVIAGALDCAPDPVAVLLHVFPAAPAGRAGYVTPAGGRRPGSRPGTGHAACCRLQASVPASRGTRTSAQQPGLAQT